MRSALHSLLLAVLIAASGPVSAGTSLEMVAAPAGFDSLVRPHENLFDVYFGGRKVGEALAVSRPGFIRFAEPARLVAMIPNLLASARLDQRLSAELESNAALACAQSNAGRCGRLAPDSIGVVVDEGHFRVDVFVNPDWLQPIAPSSGHYLPAPAAQPSLATSLGIAIAGSSQGSPTYNFQNRTVLGRGNARLRADSSYASGLGLVVDDFVAEVDRPGLRYSAGLFWAPGLDFTGHRRILGVGIGTQFDTRLDRENLSGTPLIAFLAQPARVEIFVDGRLVGSRSYGAGNAILDTSGLPDGSYPVVLKVQETGGAVREERRFFVKNAQVAPLGQPIYFAYAGMLANTRRNRPVSVARSIYYQAGTARRLTNSIALDLSLLGTRSKAMVEAGGWLLTDIGRARAAGLVSTRGDVGALLQLGSSGGPLSINFDLRRIWSKDGRPLIPLPTYVDNFGSAPPTGAQVGEGSYVQATGAIGYQLGSAHFALIGSLRKDRAIAADYSIGPSANWAILNRRGMQITLEANAQRTRTTTAGFAGFRVLFTSRNYSLLSSSGHGSINGRGSGQRSKSRMVSSIGAQYSFDDGDRTQGSVGAGFDQALDGTTVNASGSLYSRFGSARADVVHSLGGGTHYGLTFQSGAAVTGDSVALGGRDLQESAIIAAVDGDPVDLDFELLVDGQVRGRVKANASLPIFLQPYRSYEIRLRPLQGSPAWYDSAARNVTLYPGNVQRVSWRVESVVPVFGRAVLPDGRALANALVRSRHGVGETDDTGHFQIEVGQKDTLAFTGSDNRACQVRLGPLEQKDYESVGEVICR